MIIINNKRQRLRANEIANTQKQTQFFCFPFFHSSLWLCYTYLLCVKWKKETSRIYFNLIRLTNQISRIYFQGILILVLLLLLLIFFSFFFYSVCIILFVLFFFVHYSPFIILLLDICDK